MCVWQSVRIIGEVQSLVTSLPKAVRPQFTFGAFGFAGKSLHDFSVLEQAALVVTAAGATGVFKRGADSTTLRRALADMSTLLSRTTSMLSSLASDGRDTRKLPLRTDLVKAASRDESLGRTVTATTKDYSGFVVLTNDVSRFTFRTKSTPEDQIVHKYFVRAPLQCQRAVTIAKRTEYLDEGAERVAFEMVECALNNDSEDDGGGSRYVAVGKPLVWKESRQHEKTQIEWHKTFYNTQRQAKRLARKFAAVVDRYKVPEDVPRVEFINASIYTARDEAGKRFGGLCEEFLPGFRKWTDNKGGVYNVADSDANANGDDDDGDGDDDDEERQEEEEVAAALRQMTIGEDGDHVTTITSGTEGSGGSNSGGGGDAASTRRSLLAQILPDDMLLTFSHWTYVYTQRDMLVCDLQGADARTADGRPVLRLTDPSIHTHGRGGKYGATDHGSEGQNAFLKTHECTPLCKLLGIDRTRGRRRWRGQKNQRGTKKRQEEQREKATATTTTTT